MLSLAKLRVGQEAYQLSGVAESLDAYYTGAGEAAGEWIGGGSARLGLHGEVAPADLRAVLAGIRPGTGGLSPNGEVIRPSKRRVPGFDATFKAPKSASVLYAVSDDPRVQGAVIAAGNHALREAVAWLEREAIEVQRGSHNTAWVERKRAELAAAGEDPNAVGPRRLKTSGVVAATFRHRTSRAGDPLLHWHTLVANLVEGTDGKWSAFAHPDLYRHARAAGEIFQASFRAELTRTLGVEWRPGRHVPEIAGIPQRLLDGFSKRRAEIEGWIAATGAPSDPAGQQAAVLATRRAKHERETDGERLDAGWKREATTAGWGPEQAEQLLAGLTPRQPMTVEDTWRLNACGVDEHGQPEEYELLVRPEEWIGHLLRTELTVASTTFTDTDVATAVARRLGDGATVATIDRITARVVASPHVLVVDDGERRRYTSREMHGVEQRFAAAVARRTGIGPVDGSAAVADRPTLGADQAAAVERLCSATGTVSVLIGPAGTGKTFTLDTVRDAFEHAGWRVIGAGPSARAAQELTAGAGIASRTLHSLVGDVADRRESFDSSTLLVVDEAGMADIRTLEQAVTTVVAAGGRVLLVGDQHQMPAVGAGGGFAFAAERAPDVAELTVNRRQREEWEQQALAALRCGSVADAVGAYVDHGRVLVAGDAETMITAAIQRWSAALDAGLRPVLLAGSNDLVDLLNQAAIDVLAARGLLPDQHAAYGDGRYRVGERVTLRRNSTGELTSGGDRVDVANGQLGTIVAVDGGQLTVRLDRRPDVDVVLDDRYLARGGHVSHGYALSTHRAQGGTWDLSITVGLDGLYREAAYTDLSRGIAENWLIVTDPDLARLQTEAANDLDRHDTGIDPDTPSDIVDELVERLDTSRAKHLAHHIDPAHGRVDELARTVALADLETGLANARRAVRIANAEHGVDGSQLVHTLSTIDDTARHLAAGVRVRAQDRHNVGTVQHVDDANGTAHVLFVAADRHRSSVRNLPWEQLTIIDRNAPDRTLTGEAAASVQRIRDDAADRLGNWSATVTAHGASPDDLDILPRDPGAARRRQQSAGERTTRLADPPRRPPPRRRSRRRRLARCGHRHRRLARPPPHRHRRARNPAGQPGRPPHLATRPSAQPRHPRLAATHRPSRVQLADDPQSSRARQPPRSPRRHPRHRAPRRSLDHRRRPLRAARAHRHRRDPQHRDRRPTRAPRLDPRVLAPRRRTPRDHHQPRTAPLGTSPAAAARQRRPDTHRRQARRRDRHRPAVARRRGDRARPRPVNDPPVRRPRRLARRCRRASRHLRDHHS
ncbi:MAG: MobF family relaxase [Ilumatobacteraceae bacterium]